MRQLAFVGSFMDLTLAEVDLVEGRSDAVIARAATHDTEPDRSSVRPKAFDADWDLLRGKAHLRRGDLGAADAALARGASRARALGARRVLWPLDRVWADVAEARGDHALAQRQRAEAREHLFAIAASLEGVGLADRFRALPEVRATIDGQAVK